MGCHQTRERPSSDYLVEFENKLQFSKFTVRDIKKAFCHASGVSSISMLQIEKFLKNLMIQYSPTDRQNAFDVFISQFEIGEDTYDLNELLIAIFLLTKSSMEEKGLELFDLFSKRSAGCLYKEEAETAFSTICDVVCRYSNAILDQDEDVKSMHLEISVRKRNDEVVPRLVEFFLKGKSYIKYQEFEESLVKAVQTSDLLDMTSPTSIRKTMMDYLYLPSGTKAELSHVYEKRKSKAKHAFQDKSCSTLSTTPKRDQNMPEEKNNASYTF